jgi:hypothetical protein
VSGSRMAGSSSAAPPRSKRQCLDRAGTPDQFVRSSIPEDAYCFWKRWSILMISCGVITGVSIPSV